MGVMLIENEEANTWRLIEKEYVLTISYEKIFISNLFSIFFTLKRLIILRKS